jgi:hypothetical protein
MWEKTCHQNRTTRLADGNGDVSVREPGSFLRQTVQIWGDSRNGTASCPQRIVVEVVRGYQQDIDMTWGSLLLAEEGMD